LTVLAVYSLAAGGLAFDFDSFRRSAQAGINRAPKKQNRERHDMADGFTIASFRDVANGLQEGQFAVGDKRRAASLDDLPPVYRRLLDEPVTMTLAVTGPDGRPSLTPMWFDHADNEILINTASHRNKCQWIRNNPRLSLLLVNPANAYHWLQIKCSVRRELAEWEEGGAFVTRQLDRIWTKWFARSEDRGKAGVVLLQY
jgi:general stress protein 26